MLEAQMKARLKKVIRSWLGPSAIRFAQRTLPMFYKPRLIFAPDGWDTELVEDRGGWEDRRLIGSRVESWKKILEHLQSKKPFTISLCKEEWSEDRAITDHNIHITFAYVVALAARKKNNVSVLDWGSGFGHYFYLAKAAVPEARFDYHCVEVPTVARLGKQLNPRVHWHSGDTFWGRKYDLVLINASLQYVREWKEFLKRIATIVGRYLFITRMPVVEHIPSFVAIQNESGTLMLHQQLNASELLEVVERTGLCLVREFIVGDKPFIKGAPEECEMKGWLFQRKPK
jgi:putative methyltransferase (TIGR04325 family)